MEKKDFSNIQLLALDTTQGNYIVSASAGSGKTSVLTKRIFELVTEKNVKFNELLVLTFTNAAAQEMRERTRKDLIEHGYDGISNEIDSSYIMTFDAFALTLVKKYHYLVGVNKNVSIVSEDILKLQTKRFVNKILSEEYKIRRPLFLDLVNTYCIKNDNKLITYILTLNKYANLVENRDEFLKTYAECYVNKEKIEKDFISIFDAFKNELSSACYDLERFKDEPKFDKYEQYLELNQSKNYDEAKLILSNFKSVQADKNNEELVVAVNKCKAVLNKYKSFFKFASQEEEINKVLETKKYIELLCELTLELNKRLDNFKSETNSYSFADIAKFAYQIASKESINQILKNQFKYIMVDEYQDTSDLQENLINLLANNNVYVVGDVKQSIYRFRNANPTLFINRYEKLKKPENGKKIDMSENYRSRESVIYDNNRIFDSIMNINECNIDYKREHRMNYANHHYDLKSNDAYEGHEAIYYEKSKNINKATYEATIIAQDIIKKINNEYKVYDFNLKGLRPCNFSDFAILTYSKSSFSTYQTVFNELNLPLYANYDRNITDNDLTMVLTNLIKILSKTKKAEFDSVYKHCFISLMRSFLFCESDLLVEEVVKTNNYSKSNVLLCLNKIVSLTKSLSLSDTLKTAFEYLKIYDLLPTIGDVRDNLALLNYFYETAKTMENMNYSIEDFAEYFEDLKTFDIETTIQNNDKVSNSINLMTIHKSKGLQFKIVYYPELDKQFSNKGDQETVSIGKKYCFDILNPNFDLPKTFYSVCYSMDDIKEETKEKLRLFYVALTRAEEKVIFVLPNSCKSKNKNSLFDCKSFADFLSYSSQAFIEQEYDPNNSETLTVETNNKCDYNFEICDKLLIKSELIKTKRASKENSDFSDSKLLSLGNKFHYYLELVDFNNKDDLSFIKNDEDRKRIEKFLKNNIFNHKFINVAHEYSFYDEEQNVYGQIDLLLETNDNVYVIDYKLSHVEDSAYEKQVSIYRDYVKKITNKTIKVYILGILSGLLKEVLE